MNILWIEDFGGNLPAGRNILNQMFSDLLSFDTWDNDLLSLISQPSDLNIFCTQQESLHTVYLCRNYFDYAAFKQHEIINRIDVMILDIRLDNLETDLFNLAIPEPYENKAEFHKNGGFYIFNDLIHLGVPTEKICFMTGEDSTFGEFQKKCVEIYMPNVKCFEKHNAKGYPDLREWLKNQESDYIKLRRGIIEGCQFIKQWLKDNNTRKDDLLFNKVTSKKIEIDDANNYLDILESFFPLREPDDKAVVFKLFIRTLAHEWEAANPDKFKDWELERIMKITRNWSAHGHVFSQLNEQDVCYLFLMNFRLMFIGLENSILNYERHLFSLFTPVTEMEVKLHVPLAENYVSLAKLNITKKYFNFHDILNDAQNKNLVSGSELIKGLYQLFWFLTSTGTVNIIDNTNLNYQFNYFDYAKTEFFKSFSQHIYSRSFL